MIRGVAVVVPARDEQDTIAACLDAIRVALPGEVRSAVCVVLDRCTDDTERIACRSAPWARLLVNRADLPLGTLRDLGARAALAALGVPARRSWLLSTDADSVVRPGWVRDHLAQAARGVCGYAGATEITDWAGHTERTRLRYLAVAGDPSREHVYGANLGVRADAYLAVGGFAALATGEDQDLWDRLRLAGHILVTGVAAPVLTSSRRHGRATGGVADLLAGLIS
ncbi:glycosyltransferase family 2 protein [Kutzneria viridogrisea]|uniref:4,4'-diaponeurosporenoate glycosyltransferase n=1 Tax=Kutzneria viridogrisea TaxID=47990 RepID=A0ABR6BC33_9PSEU|nr:glycosyltransferase involved in cell wall biosynthesis [Kutzneria viridogrisea]